MSDKNSVEAKPLNCSKFLAFVCCNTLILKLIKTRTNTILYLGVDF